MHETTLRVLKAIHKLSFQGWPPKYEEISAECGVVKSVVWYHVKKLAAMDYVKHVPRQARSVAVTEEGIREIAVSLLEGDQAYVTRYLRCPVCGGKVIEKRRRFYCVRCSRHEPLYGQFWWCEALSNVAHGKYEIMEDEDE